ncbi:MAG: hypothetical protein ACC657_18150 [Thiohalomonadales bacterium]
MIPDDYGWFTLAEFKSVLDALNKNQNPSFPTILVGGQALVAWIKHYDIPVPNSDTPALTQDIDFLGSDEQAKLLAKEIGAKINIAGMDDHTPNTAVLSFRSSNTNKILIIDFLSYLIGLSEQEIRKLAVAIKFESLSSIDILHPILCLKSRIENLHKLKSKRNGNGITQARAAIEVVKKFLGEISKEEHGMRQTLNAIKKLRLIALSDAGIFVYHEYDLDILTAIDLSLFKESKFVDQGWPQLCMTVNNKRKKKVKAIK